MQLRVENNYRDNLSVRMSANAITHAAAIEGGMK